MAAAAIPFAMKAAPYVASGIGSLIGKKLSGPSAAQKTGMAGTQTASNQLLQQGSQLSQQGGQNLSAAGSYYQNILGSRSAANQSLAPETTTALDYYKGASGKLDRTMTGGSRDYAKAELERQKVGQLAGMLPAARANAAQGAYGVGSTQTGQGVNASANALYGNNALFNQGGQLQEQQQKGGNVMGKMIFDIMKNLPQGKGKGKPGGDVPMPNPSTQAGNMNMPWTLGTLR